MPFGASVLALVTVGTLVYTLFQARIQTRQIHSKLTAVAIGISLGIISSFLGIGGGPINLVVLDYFLSMKAKKAATNSLYIILFSQAASFLCTILTGRVPEFLPQFLIVMIIGGVLGGIVGSKISRTLTTKKVRELFYIMMSVIVGINTYNVIGFLR